MISPKIKVIIVAILMLLTYGFYRAKKDNNDTLCYIVYVFAIALAVVVFGIFAKAF